MLKFSLLILQTAVYYYYIIYYICKGKFLEPDKKKRTQVHCKLCPKVLKYAGNTTNLRFHLELNQYKQLQSAKTKEVVTHQKTQPIKDFFEHATPLSTSSPRWNTLTQAICYFIAKDMLPIGTINDPGFRKMIREFEPCYNPPDSKTLAVKYLPQMF